EFRHVLFRSEGVAAPDAATSAAANGAFIPTLVLGVPGGATTAVLLGAFLLYGITPGPLLFDDEPRLVWGLLVSFLIGHLLLLVLNLPLRSEERRVGKHRSARYSR